MVAKNQLLGKSSAYFHFHPDISIKIKGNQVISDNCKLDFLGVTAMRVKEYTYAHGYNNIVKAKLVEVLFNENLKTNITLNVSN
jgi:hypothetical protein